VSFLGTVHPACVPEMREPLEAKMSESTRQSQLHSTVGLVAEYVVTGLIMLMTLVSTLRMLGIFS
jgi:hypothetical protein